MSIIKTFFKARERGLKSRFVLVPASIFVTDINESGTMCCAAQVCEYILSSIMKICRSPDIEEKRFTGLL